MQTKEKLAQALDQAKAPAIMIQKARLGYYDDYESELATPIVQLVHDARSYGLSDIALRGMKGEFDGTKEEGDAWFQKEGRHLLSEGGK